MALVTSTVVPGFYSWLEAIRGIHYGLDSTNSALPKLLSSLGIRRALIVTGKTLYNKTNVVKNVEKLLKEHNAYGATFYEISQHSPIAEIRQAVGLFKNHQCDSVVAIGGGSPIDSSKAIRYHIQKETGGSTPPQIAIPTTLSAAEYTYTAGFTDDEGNKVAVVDPSLAPAGIILDALLTLDTPERLWLGTGMRALDHAVESLYRLSYPLPLKNLAYAAIADLFTLLPQSKANPNDVNVRQKLQLASWMSLWPIGMEKLTPLGLSHSLGHKLGATYGIPHGITSCLTLAPTVALQASIASSEDKELLANALFYLRQPSTGTVEGDVLKLSSLIQRLVTDLGLQTCLSEYNVSADDLPKIAAKVVAPSESSFPRVMEVLRALM